MQHLPTYIAGRFARAWSRTSKLDITPPSNDFDPTQESPGPTLVILAGVGQRREWPGRHYRGCHRLHATSMAREMGRREARSTRNRPGETPVASLARPALSEITPRASLLEHLLDRLPRVPEVELV